MNENNKTSGSVEVYGARVHNLKNIDVTIPHDSLCVVTGLSGCGKSSLAFDTIFAEGQRRYIETFSSYARNMLGSLERPDVNKITGLNPVISIEQKTVNKNPRSTIGTTTEVYDFFRLLYARLGEARSYISGKPMVKYSKDKIITLLLEKYNDRKIQILAPLVKNRKGHYKEVFETLRHISIEHSSTKSNAWESVITRFGIVFNFDNANSRLSGVVVNAKQPRSSNDLIVCD